MPRALWEGAGVGTGEEGLLPGFGAQARFGGVEGIPPVLQVPTNLSRVLSSSVERQRWPPSPAVLQGACFPLCLVPAPCPGIQPPCKKVLGYVCCLRVGLYPVQEVTDLSSLLQGRSTYVVPTQQYPVQAGAPSFYPGTNPPEFGTYGTYWEGCFAPRCSSRPSTPSFFFFAALPLASLRLPALRS